MSTPPQKPVTKSGKKIKKKKKKTDPFWPIVIILSILAFTGSFWFFYMLTSKINTRTFPTTDTPKLMITPTPDVNLDGDTYMVGDNTRLEETPAPQNSDELIAVATTAPSTTPNTTASTAIEASPESTPRPTPTPLPSRTPKPSPTPRPTATPSAIEKSAFRVQVGAYGNRSDAEKASGKLSEKGYSTLITEENGRFRIQLGVFDSQESALSLAEEITQQGYEVVVRKVTL